MARNGHTSHTITLMLMWILGLQNKYEYIVLSIVFTNFECGYL